MGKVIKNLFGGGSDAAAAQARRAASDQAGLQLQMQQNAEADADKQAGRTRRVPRGRRVLSALDGMQATLG